ncbi:hypothetical protein CBM2634_P180008 [Cupriavidus taiwanensis]|uniref:Uncharacterized protein n=1 Tax=Cupriavidus taiwanensis TaxID=164546 RepID=A0A375JAJ1_9BURK|nr:hypothetical protein CBM2634_P180008 [Cupriavidus taiwanensis]
MHIAANECWAGATGKEAGVAVELGRQRLHSVAPGAARSQNVLSRRIFAYATFADNLLVMEGRASLRGAVVWAARVIAAADEQLRDEIWGAVALSAGGEIG